jgi:hypothetical protein
MMPGGYAKVIPNWQPIQPFDGTGVTLLPLPLDAQPLKSCSIYELTLSTQLFTTVGSLDADSANEVFQRLSSWDHTEKPRNR